MLVANEHQPIRREGLMTPTRSFARIIGLGALCMGGLVWAPSAGAPASSSEVTQQSMPVQSRSIAQQLGAKLNPEQREELTLGVTLNGTLQEPEKLEKLGISGMHKGARVTAMRTAPQKLIVEVDELEPVPITRKVTLRIDDQGRLSAP
jgi:hypothetical protein